MADKKFTHVIFDLDGTLLDTLEDLADATNWVCEQHGWPVYPVEAYKQFIGNGAAKLLERVVPAGVEITSELRARTTKGNENTCGEGNTEAIIEESPEKT